jgi:hypothetical protein
MFKGVIDFLTSNFNSLNFNTFLFNFNVCFIWLNHISIALVLGVYGTVNKYLLPLSSIACLTKLLLCVLLRCLK